MRPFPSRPAGFSRPSLRLHVSCSRPKHPFQPPRASLHGLPEPPPPAAPTPCREPAPPPPLQEPLAGRTRLLRHHLADHLARKGNSIEPLRCFHHLTQQSTAQQLLQGR